MSDLLGLPCIHGEDATICSICWAPALATLCMRCEHVHYEDRPCPLGCEHDSLGRTDEGCVCRHGSYHHRAGDWPHGPANGPCDERGCECVRFDRG